MDIIDKLNDDNLWMEFLDYRLSRGDLTKKDREDLQSFVEGKEYEKCVCNITNLGELSTPRLMEINKNGVGKKRLVFTFERDENYVLKMIAYLLKEYDNIFSDNLYSFRNDTGVKKAVGRILSSVDFKITYSYKVDIHDYFNSINAASVLEIFRGKMPGEERLCAFFEKMFENPCAVFAGETINVKKGVMAGTPTAGFFANLYLAEMDSYFNENGIIYARYSDDIIVFSENENEINEYERIIKKFFENKNLEVNPRKEVRTAPGEKIEFLGFEMSPKGVNVSDATIRKLKAKIRRKTKALYRWKIKKSADDERTAGALIRFLNNKFYDNKLRGEITWCRWYFPLLTTDDKLKIIDEYAVSCIRYLYTGKHNKKNYNLRYADISALGFKSLVNNFWKYKKGNY